MKRLLLLAAAASLAACHNRSDESVGAAPDRGDTTAVTHQIDSTRTGPPGVQGRPENGTVTPDSVAGADSATIKRDTSATGAQVGPTSIPQDTLGPRTPNAATGDTTAYPRADSTMRDSTGNAR
jgi:hypothetical protein